MIHYSAVYHIIEKKDAKGIPIPFSCLYRKRSSGELITIENAVVTSSYHADSSFTVKFINSGEIRKLRSVLFMQVNGIEVYV